MAPLSNGNEGPPAVRLSARQQLNLGTESTASPLSAVEALLAALHAPVTLEWQVDLGDGALASVEAELHVKGCQSWPPREVSFAVKSPNVASHSLGIAVPSRTDASKFGHLLELAVSTLPRSACFVGCGGNVCADATQKDEVAESNRQALELNGGAINTSPASCLPVACCHDNSTSRVQETGDAANVETLSERLHGLPLLDSDTERGIFQLECLKQWHPNVCGHHALTSVACIVAGRPERLHDEDWFWQQTLTNTERLAQYGEKSGSWPRSRVTGGVVDDVHVCRIIEEDPELRGRVTVTPSVEDLRRLLQDQGHLRQDLQDVCSGKKEAHGILLGATTHWYAAVAVAPASSANGATLWFMDSHNQRMACLRGEEDVARHSEGRLEACRTRVLEELREHEDWRHRPEAHRERVFEEGQEEWWKGKLRSALFWRHKPRAVRDTLIRQECSEICAYLGELSAVLRGPAS